MADEIVLADLQAAVELLRKAGYEVTLTVQGSAKIEVKRTTTPGPVPTPPKGEAFSDGTMFDDDTGWSDRDP